jgi:hypothetical protein
MSAAPRAPSVVALAAMLLGGAGCIFAAIADERAFFPAWLASFLFWISVPLAAVTLVLVHDLTGGRWMRTARPVLSAAAAMMPVSTIAFLPILAGLGHLYVWSGPGRWGLGNAFYLNDTFFIARYAVYFVIWNAAAFWALAAPRNGVVGVAPAVSWISAVGLLLLAFSVTFAAFDWVMSIEPHFWSSIFGMLWGSNAFVTGLALLLLVLALSPPAAPAARDAYHDDMADLAAILLATTIFWAYTEFLQFLIIWEEDLHSEIPWYLHRMAGAWQGVIYAIAGSGFFIPFFVLLWTPSKRNRAIVAAVCTLMLIAHLAYGWWQVLPDMRATHFGWIDAAAFFALGGLWMLLFLFCLSSPRPLLRRAAPATRKEAQHG